MIRREKYRKIRDISDVFQIMECLLSLFFLISFSPITMRFA